MTDNILEFFYSTRNSYPNIIPCLVGPTGSGKTTVVREFFAKKGLADRRLLLSSMLPEEVCGLPRIVPDDRGGYRTEWTLPEWFTSDEPIGVFIDELDKASEMVVATILTFISERRIRDRYLHPDSFIVAAMQPVDYNLWVGDETRVALSARMCFLPVVESWKYVAEKYGVEIPFEPVPVTPPVLPTPSPRQVDWYLQHYPELVSANLESVVGYGMFPDDVYTRLRRACLGKAEYLALIIPRLNEEPSMVEELELAEVGAVLSDHIDKINAKVLAAAYKMLLKNGSIELISGIHRRQGEYVQQLSKTSPDGLVDYTISSADEIAQEMSALSKWYAEERSKENTKESSVSLSTSVQNGNGKQRRRRAKSS